MGMKCRTCKHFWHMIPCMESPYGEAACMKQEVDLWGTEPEDVENCADYEEEKRT